MLNPTKLLELLAKLPKGSKASQEAVKLEMAAREAAQAAAYAPHTPPTDAGKKAIANAKQTLITPEQQAKMEAELRQKSKQKFLDKSKVKQRLFHGTNKDIEQFDPQYIGKNDFGWYGPGHYLSADPTTASAYADYEKVKETGRLQSEPSEGANVLPVHAQLRNPYYWPEDRPIAKTPEEAAAIGKELREQGYDGIIVSNKYQEPEYAGHHEVIVFDPKRIKSAIGNVGTYDITNPDITKKDGGLAMAEGGQAFPLQDEFEAELERRRFRPRTRAGVPVEDTNVLGGALSALGETLLGAGRGAVSATLGAPADLLNLLNVKQMGTPDIPYGSEYFRDVLPLAPTTQTGKTAQQLGEFLPFNPEQPVQAGVAGVKKAGKALAPTMADLLEAELKRSGMIMGVAPEGKAAKVKAPANEIGFYNPAEKAALNLQRKKGTGDSFISDLKKQPGVTDERIIELGLDQFRGKPNVTKEEIVAATEQNRIPLQESVKRERDEATIEELERRYDELVDRRAEAAAFKDRHALDEYDREMNENLAQQKALKSVEGARFSPSEYPDYSMPGGTDYREIRIKIPEKPHNIDTSQWKVETFAETPEGRKIRVLDQDNNVVQIIHKYRGSDDLAIANAAKEHAISSKESNNFYDRRHHGDEPNVLLHLRVANHADAEGKNGLLIDELQSDWHQEGAKKGYKGNTEKEYENYFNSLKDKYVDHMKKAYMEGGTDPDRAELLATNMYNNVFNREGYRGIAKGLGEEEKLLDISERYKKDIKGVPNAPFKDNWYQLGLKRAIKEAADTGMDRVYLTTGAKQADRYDLSNHIDAIKFNKMNDGRVFWTAEKDGQRITGGDNAPNELDSIIGKDVAQRIRDKLDEGPGQVSGLDLQVGGEGMKQWYDKTYKNYLEKYAKQHGSKLGITKLKTAQEGDNLFEVVLPNGKIVASRPNRKQAEATAASFDGAEVREIDHSEPVYYIDITPEMRETAKKGQSYKDGGAVQPEVIDLQHMMMKRLMKGFAVGGAVYNTTPDISDSQQMLQGPAV